MNIWNIQAFKQVSYTTHFKLFSWIKQFFMNLKYSKQRIKNGYANCDVWETYNYLEHLIPDMLTSLKDKRFGSAYVDDNFLKKYNIEKFDDIHEQWTEVLNVLIYHWRESCEDTCSIHNPAEKDIEHLNHWIQDDKFKDAYKLILILDSKIYQYRKAHKDIAFNMTRDLFYDLWD